MNNYQELIDYIEDAWYALFTKRNLRENAHFDPPLNEKDEAQYVLISILHDMIHSTKEGN